MRLKHLLLVCSLITFSACENEEEVPIETLEGTLQWTGRYEIDGCGYILSVSGSPQDYKPNNESAIPSSYQTGAPIEVVVKALNYNKKVTACMAGSQFNQIKILDIQRK